MTSQVKVERGQVAQHGSHSAHRKCSEGGAGLGHQTRDPAAAAYHYGSYNVRFYAADRKGYNYKVESAGSPKCASKTIPNPQLTV